MGAQTQRVDPRVLNMQQRALVLNQAVEMTQQIYSTNLSTPSNAPVVNVVPRNVGLIKKFIVVVTGTVGNTSATNTLSITDFGLMNVLSQVQFTDLNNNVRINTAGWHLGLLNSLKYRQPYAGAFQISKSPVASGANQKSWNDGSQNDVFPILAAPATLGLNTATGSFRMVYEVPLAYSDDDLRGVVYANVVNATMQLQLTINTAGFFAAGSTADTTKAVYSSADSSVLGTLTNVTITVYQVYLDQLPVGQNGVVLPVLDMATVYELKNTPFTALPNGIDFPVPYANFRDFLSTIAILNDDGTATGRKAGTDINYWALQSANFTNLWKIEPLLAAQYGRQVIKTDLPLGTYYFSSRRKPISTTQYGNMELVVNNTSAVNSSGYLLIGWEDFALVNTLTQAGSLAAAG